MNTRNWMNWGSRVPVRGATPTRKAARRRRAPFCGFTLIEVLVVVAIIALLVGILLPSLLKAREEAKKAGCLANLKTLSQAMIMYADENKDLLPNGNPPNIVDDPDGTTAVLVGLANRFVKSAKPFHCPSDRDPEPRRIVTGEYLEPDSGRVSYDFYSVWWLPEYGPKVVRLKQAPVVWDLHGGNPKRSHFQNHGNTGGNVGYVDGHADWQPQPRWVKENWPRGADTYYPKTK